MKCFFLFLFSFFFGFFDFFLFVLFFCLFLVFFFFDFWSFKFTGMFFCDDLSFFLLYLSFLVFLFCVFSQLVDSWSNNFYLGFVFVLFSIFFLLFMSFSFFSVFMFYVCFELIFMFMFFFVLVWGYSPERLQASFYMVFYTILVSFPFLVYLVYFEENLMSFKFLFSYSFSFYWWFFLFFVFMVKLPVYGVHLWLPKAHVEAPVSGSMVLAGVLLKLGGYGFIRFSFLSSFSLFYHMGYFFSLGLLGGLISCFLCLRQSDLKAFVAYSSVCHMGFGLSGIYCFSFFGFNGGVYMFIAHGFCSSCLFYILYVFYERFYTRSIFILKGIGVIIPFVMLFFFLFSVLNMGVPPSFSFFSEVIILSGLGYLNLYSFFFVGFFLFFAGLYGIFLYVVSSHGISLLGGIFGNFTVREYLNMYGHIFPLGFIPLFLGAFFV